MKHQKTKLITSAVVVAAALSLGPIAYGESQSSDNGATHSGTAAGQAAYGSNAPAPQSGAISGGASRYGAKDPRTSAGGSPSVSGAATDSSSTYNSSRSGGANSGSASNAGSQTANADVGEGTDASANSPATDRNSGPHIALPANSPTPTGDTSAQQVPTTNQQLLNGAESIRRALDANAQTAHENVTIVPENGKITLRGSVSGNTIKAQIENMAYEAGQPNVVVSDLTVQNQ